MHTADPRTEVHAVSIMTTMPSSSALSAGRLVVVIPAVVDEAQLAGRILEAAGRREVLLLGISLNFAQETELRRGLALLAAFIRNAGTEVDIRMEHGQDWLQRLSTYVASDDVLSCCLERESQAAGRPLHDVLSAALNRPIYVFSGPEPWDEGAKGFGRDLAPWLASVGVIVGFLVLQITVSRSGNGAVTTLLLMLSLLGEVGLIWLCNALLS